MTVEQAESASHQGQCDEDVRALSLEPGIAAQLSAVDPETLRSELREYGAWDDVELSDHPQNLQRLLWIAACDISEQAREGVA
jgi:folate-binding Fe-S cluster repair protein YgfZ